MCVHSNPTRVVVLTPLSQVRQPYFCERAANACSMNCTSGLTVVLLVHVAPYSLTHYTWIWRFPAKNFRRFCPQLVRANIRFSAAVADATLASRVVHCGHCIFCYHWSAVVLRFLCQVCCRAACPAHLCYSTIKALGLLFRVLRKLLKVLA